MKRIRALVQAAIVLPFVMTFALVAALCLGLLVRTFMFAAGM